MATVSGTLTAEGATAELQLKPGQSATYSVTGTFTGLPYLQRKRRAGTYATADGGTADTVFSGTVTNETKRDEWFRINLLDTDSETPVTGTLTYEIADAADVLDSVVLNDHVYLEYTDDGVHIFDDLDVDGDFSLAGAASITGNATVEGGTVRLGATDAAAPAAQSVTVQSVVAGTTNTAGAALTINGSKGTGTGAGGAVIIKVAPAGSTGSTQNALATALTIGGDKSATFVHSVVPSTAVAVANLPATPVLGMIAQVNDATAPAVGSTVADGGAAAALVWYNGTNWTVIGI